MLRSTIVRIADICTRHPWYVIALALALSAFCAGYTERHFAIRTNINELISPELPWAQRVKGFLRAFPQRDILVVVDAPTPELVEQAADRLQLALEAKPEMFPSVRQPQGGRFFERNGLLYLPTQEVKNVADWLTRADDLIGTLAADSSLRGTLDALSLGLIGVQRKEITLDDMAHTQTMAAETIEAILGGRFATFSWQALVSNKPAGPSDLRRLIEVQPWLDFGALEPGRAATDAIRRAAANQHLAAGYGARVSLTGLIPIADDEFDTIKQNAGLNATISLLTVLAILWVALCSARIIFAVVVSITIGLAISAAWGLFLVGALNLISAGFFVLFVGLGIDFGIQFSVRYRAERHDCEDLSIALHNTAVKAGGPLALAAAATAIGFSSFLPTDYRGLSELGQIAGSGMIIAFLTSITVLPALLAILNPRAEPHSIGFAALAPVDRFLEHHRTPVVALTVLAVVLASPLLLFLPFDFNPLHLRSPKVESVAAFLELRKDPQAEVNSIEIVAPNLAAADLVARRLSELPQVSQAITLSNLVPGDQEEKLNRIREAATTIAPSLNPQDIEPPPTDDETIASLTSTADLLSNVAGTEPGPGADAARRLSSALLHLARADPALRKQAETTIVEPLRSSLERLRQELKPQPITAETVPRDLAREWITPDGQARVRVLPKGDPDDTAVLRDFVRAVLTIEPNATGEAVALYESGNTVVRAFVEAGIFALSAIAVLLWIALRRIGDVLLTLVPLLVAGVVTLELCVVFGLPLNFANIIALPLLLGVGVAFKIYYVMAWRAGKTALLQSVLTRAVIFSAMTTATAFGSLWMSSHPGTSSMGKLMALALVCTMAAAVLFQPALMGPPREKSGT
ncbi:MMPL family transporter [Bradyrhizobium erythrophlei]|uniref:hopanoid transporter HpnN n=1 Tax=Bradyrhizobium erythrophlei TaxID=1437360 RepID=UPI0035ED8AF7